MNKALANSSLGQQLALLCAGLCLLVSLAVITLAGIGGQHLLEQQQAQYGRALARQVALRVSSAMENGDILSATAALQRYLEISESAQITLTDVEGKVLGQAGAASGPGLERYSAPVYIDADIAGKVSLTVRVDQTREAQQGFILSLCGLAVLLAIAAWGGGRKLGQSLGARLHKLSRTIALEETSQSGENEVVQLERQVQSLPMDLLRTRSEGEPRDENYRTTAVLYLHLTSLVDYVNTLDERALRRYTDRLHQVIYAAAGFYGGELEVTRQFGVAVYFSGDNKAGSAAFRAASCGWLIRAVCARLQEQVSRQLDVAMAISQSELGAGDGDDIYPGLYMQHTLDELQMVCARKPPNVLLSPAVMGDVDISGRVQASPTEVGNYSMLDSFANPYDDLLERQLRLILKRLADSLRN
ncbi:MAG: hypothetical protein HKN19_02350 [Halioglobus sp.]|nr:hypothetical protein [Halioglobus sp.]